jgi:hypothetical protein
MKRGKGRLILAGSFFLLFCCMNNTVYGQLDTLLYRILDQERAKPKRCSFGLMTNVGFITPPKDNTHYRIRHGKSLQGTLGVQFKVRVAKFYQMGLDLAVSGNLYNIRQDKGKWFIDTIQYKKEQFSTGEAYLAFTHHFKLNRGVGETWGLEASIYGGYVYSGSRKTIAEDYNSDNIYAKMVYTKTVERELTYLEHWVWGLQLKITYHGVGIYAQYRMTNIVKLGRPVDYPAFDMPRLAVGLTFSGKAFPSN